LFESRLRKMIQIPERMLKSDVKKYQILKTMIFKNLKIQLSWWLVTKNQLKITKVIFH